MRTTNGIGGTRRHEGCVVPAALPERVLKPLYLVRETDHGRSSDSRASSQLVSQLIYWMPLPKVRVARAFSADGIGRSQSPLRGSSGIGLRRTGFSLRSGCWARHRDEAQDIVVGDERQSICKSAMTSARRLARTQVLTDAPALFGIEIAPTLTQFLALLRR
jgi:hypothetical protein